MIKAAVFDFDGVIADSFDFVLGQINRYLPLVGKPQIDSAVLRENDVETVMQSYGLNRPEEFVMLLLLRRAIHENLRNIPVQKHIIGIFEQLAKQAELFILTSNSRGNVADYLKAHRIHDYFQEIHGNFLLFDKSRGLAGILNKHEISPENSIYIGDEPRDIRVAREVGSYSLAVSWGYSRQDLLEQSKPDRIAAKPEDILGALTEF